ncbi:MAG: hypothetical protein LBN37_07315, partial [Bacteroidales bacterium]|nr:hypothetical protein [Bacteroidales bacterium]
MKYNNLIFVTIVAVTTCCNTTSKFQNMKNNLNLDTVPVCVGIGTLDISFDLPVPLFRLENDTLPIDTLLFERQKGGIWLFKTTHLQSSFQPYIMTGGDSDENAHRHISMGLIRFLPRLTFRVLEANDLFYRIVINENTFETVVI